MMQQQKNLEQTLELYRRVDAQNFDHAAELLSPRCQLILGGKALDVPSWIAMGRMFMTAFPDGRHVFDMTEAVGDYVLMHGYFTGTHKQEFQGIPATGKVIKISFTMIDKVIDGKLVEHRGDLDSAGLVQQLTQ